MFVCECPKGNNLDDNRLFIRVWAACVESDHLSFIRRALPLFGITVCKSPAARHTQTTTSSQLVNYCKYVIVVSAFHFEVSDSGAICPNQLGISFCSVYFFHRYVSNR